MIVYFHITRDNLVYSIVPLIQNKLSFHIFNGAKNGNLACDMFFIIMGYFLSDSLSVKKTDLLVLAKKKFIRFYPLIICNVILSITFCLYIFNIDKYLPHSEIYKLLLLDGTGFQVGLPNVTWFISVAFWVSLFYAYLYKILSKDKFYFILFLIISFCYTLLIHSFGGNITGNGEIVLFVFNAGILRGLAGIGFGFLIFGLVNWADYLVKMKDSIFTRTVFTSLEAFLFYFVFNNLLFHAINYSSNFLIIVGFIALFILFLVKKGYLSRFFEKDLFSVLGKYIFPIYMTHIFVLSLLKKYIWIGNLKFIESHFIFSIFISFIPVIIFAIAIHHFVEKPISRYLKSKVL